MKSVIMALGIFILIIILSGTIYLYIDKISLEMTDCIEKNEKYFAKNDFENAKNEMKEIETIWNDKRDNLAMFVNHKHIEEIDYCVARMKKALLTQEETDFFMESATLKLRILELLEAQRITFSNIL